MFCLTDTKVTPMSTRKIILCMSFLFSTQSIFVVHAATEPSESVRTMAAMLNSINHYPGSSEKEKLRGIINSPTSAAYEKTIATAILNMEHSPTPGDKKSLARVISDDSVPQPGRDIAKIVHDFSHKASSADRAVLKKYMR